MKSSASTHKMEELVLAEHRDIASSNANNKFNLATDQENIDFNIPGVPNSTVKRSHGVNVHNLIQKIENHPQRQALQSDLQQHRGTGRKKVIENTTLQINSKRSAGNEDTRTFTINSFVIHGSESPCWKWIVLKKCSARWTDWRTKTTPILPQKKNTMYIVAFGGYVRFLWVPTRCP